MAESLCSCPAEDPQAAAELAALTNGQLHIGATPVVETDEQGCEWLDISQLVQQAAGEMAVGEMMRSESLTLFDSIAALEAMNPAVDTGLLTQADEEEIAQWDASRRLTLREALWISEELFCSEMEWHSSASLLQTLYRCNYFTIDQVPAGVGKRSANNGDGANAVRDLVLYPLVVALGACCRLVWEEYQKENVFPDEDVRLRCVHRLYLEQFSLGQAGDMLDVAEEFLAERAVASGGDAAERQAAEALLCQVAVRRLFLRCLAQLSAEFLEDDPGALDRSMQVLKQLRLKHAEYVQLRGAHPELGVAVAGVFDPKCMRRFPLTVPVKPMTVMPLADALQVFAGLINDLGELRPILRAQSVEELMYLFTRFSRRHPQPLPFVRSLAVSLFSSGANVLLTQPTLAFVRRAVAEVSGGHVWRALAQHSEGDSRASVFCHEAVRTLLDWFRTLCQNTSRQRRIAMKYLAGWDALQADAEQLDAWLYVALGTAGTVGEREREASDAAHNPFVFSSWAYHMKLLMMETALMSGMRLETYQPYELPQVLGYTVQVFEAHEAHLERMASMIRRHSLADTEKSTVQQQQQQRSSAQPWCMQPVEDAACLRQIARWRALVRVQKDLATAQWLVAHACERLGVSMAPWLQRARRAASRSTQAQAQTDEALQVCRREESAEAQAVRYALRFRVFSRLSSPTPFSFAGWATTQSQLDRFPLGDLFTHASHILTSARSLLEPESPDLAVASEWWVAEMRLLGYALVAASVGIARILASPAIAESSALAATGMQALAFRTQIYEVDPAGCTGEASAENNASDAQPAAASKSKAKAKRDRKKKKQQRDLETQAREWFDSVDVLGLSVSWRCCETDGQMLDWSQPTFTMQQQK
ncbi:N-alpha-acetyltransferase, non-catalitic subunit [Coemansia sp. Benny D115]|nr:N-alpha-acetyltransferase, non-catalitic subunit [Coemansia sp. Benny D115]